MIRNLTVLEFSPPVGILQGQGCLSEAERLLSPHDRSVCVAWQPPCRKTRAPFGILFRVAAKQHSLYLLEVLAGHDLRKQLAASSGVEQTLAKLDSRRRGSRVAPPHTPLGVLPKSPEQVQGWGILPTQPLELRMERLPQPGWAAISVSIDDVLQLWQLLCSLFLPSAHRVIAEL